MSFIVIYYHLIVIKWSLAVFSDMPQLTIHFGRNGSEEPPAPLAEAVESRPLDDHQDLDGLNAKSEYISCRRAVLLCAVSSMH